MDIYFNDAQDIIFEDTDNIQWERSIPIVLTVSATPDLRTCNAIGEMLDFGGKLSTQRGFCYIEGSVVDPTIDDLKIYDNGTFDIGQFEKTISSLVPSTYTIRAYCINTAGVGYGNSVTFVIIPDKRIIIRDIVKAQKRAKKLAKERQVKAITFTKPLTQVMVSVKVRLINSNKNRQVVCTPVHKQKEGIMLEFSPKQSFEEYYISFNFSRVITPLTNIESATVVVVDEAGEDVTDELTDVSKQNIDGNKVTVWVMGGDEQIYKITCQIVMDNGEKFEQDATIQVTEL